MLVDVREDLTRKYRDLKIWIENKIKDQPPYSVERGLYYVYVYGIFEWLVTTVVQRTLEEINDYNGQISDYIYDIYPLIFSGEFDALEVCGKKTKWNRRKIISDRLNEDGKVNLDLNILPTDGKNIRFDQLKSIAAAFGKSGDILPNDRIRGYLHETVEYRNHIAHGDETPDEIGVKKTKKEILSNFQGMQELSEYILDQYDKYAINKEYLKAHINVL